MIVAVAEIPRGAVQPLRTPGHDCNSCAFREQPPGGSEPHAARASCDQRHLAFVSSRAVSIHTICLGVFGYS